MLALIRDILDDRAGSIRAALIGLYSLLITALLAYGFGLRHAVDADPTATMLSTHFEQFKSIGGIISALVSALFLFIIAIAS